MALFRKRSQANDNRAEDTRCCPRGSFFGRLMRKICTGIGALVLVFVVLGLIAGAVVKNKGTVRLPDSMVLVMNVEDPIGETEHARSLTDPLAPAGYTVREIVATLDRAAGDSRVKGLLVSLDNGTVEMAHIQELRAAVKRFRASGKFAYFYTASFADLGSGIGAYYLATAFDQIWMQPVGMVTVTGVGIEMPFAKDLLDKVGVRAAFFHREEYKSAMESFTNDHMSPANKEELSSILDDIARQLTVDISQDRKIAPATLKTLIDKGLFTGDEALAAHLIDKLDYADVLLDNTTKAAKPQVPGVSFEDYAGAVAQGGKAEGKPKVAIVEVSGEIVSGSEARAGYAPGDYIAGAIQTATDDAAIKVIVLRVDSPGGSPTASETIRRAVVKARQKGKKILVSMGPLAASGGYWIVVDADKIYALPTTLTGSIGVIMGKFEGSGLWQKVGVNWDTLTWGQNAGLWSINQSLTPSQTAAMNDALDDTYASFLSRVAKGRKMDPAAVRLVAKGRAWTGIQAVKIGLVDQIGGLDTTLDEAARLSGAADRTGIDTVILPAPESPLHQLMHVLQQQAALAPVLGNDTILRTAAPYLRQIEAMQSAGPVKTYAPLTAP